MFSGILITNNAGSFISTPINNSSTDSKTNDSFKKYLNEEYKINNGESITPSLGIDSFSFTDEEKNRLEGLLADGRVYKHEIENLPFDDVVKFRSFLDLNAASLKIDSQTMDMINVSGHTNYLGINKALFKTMSEISYDKDRANFLNSFDNSIVASRHFDFPVFSADDYTKTMPEGFDYYALIDFGIEQIEKSMNSTNVSVFEREKFRIDKMNLLKLKDNYQEVEKEKRFMPISTYERQNALFTDFGEYSDTSKNYIYNDYVPGFIALKESNPEIAEKILKDFKETKGIYAVLKKLKLTQGLDEEEKESFKKVLGDFTITYEELKEIPKEHAVKIIDIVFNRMMGEIKDNPEFDGFHLIVGEELSKSLSKSRGLDGKIDMDIFEEYFTLEIKHSLDAILNTTEKNIFKVIIGEKTNSFNKTVDLDK